jgi:hypothetical protein
MFFTRQQITKTLIDEIQTWDFTIAAWEGGSAANQRQDSFSDLDLVLAVENEKTKEAFQKIEKLLSKISPIDHIWRVPEPTWHGHGQRFYKLHDGPEFFFLDVVIMEEKAKQRFLEKERHGTPVIYFDKKNFIQVESAHTQEFNEKRSARLRTIKDSYPFFKILVEKEIRRNRPLDAMAFYRSLTNLLIEIQGMKFRPYRYDFGLRYIHVDFPLAEQKQLQQILYPSDLNSIQNLLPIIDEKMRSLFQELMT